VWEQV